MYVVWEQSPVFWLFSKPAAYVAMTTVAVYYLFAWGEEGTRKGASKREKRRRQTEYCILLAASVLPIVVASGVEVGLIPAFMAYLT